MLPETQSQDWFLDHILSTAAKLQRSGIWLTAGFIFLSLLSIVLNTGVIAQAEINLYFISTAIDATLPLRLILLLATITSFACSFYLFFQMGSMLHGIDYLADNNHSRALQFKEFAEWMKKRAKGNDVINGYFMLTFAIIGVLILLTVISTFIYSFYI